MSVVIAVHAPDLMDRVRIEGAIAAAGAIPVRPHIDAVTQPACAMALVDVTTPGATDLIRQLADAGTMVIGFGPHVDGPGLSAASASGADEVLARSVFFRRLGSLIESVISGTAPGVQLSSAPMPQEPTTRDPLWFKDAVIYEVSVRSFSDSNGDGIGDLAGLTSRLDYLQDLGVTAIWLLPFYPSPLRDDGYDIGDYFGVHPDFGTLDDFANLVSEAHARGLKIITEIVINHTSDQHEWFTRAVSAPPGSPEREFYVWSDTEDLYKDARIIFTDTETSNWTWNDEAGAFFWHRFFSHQPDLNYANPLVRQAVHRVVDYWLDMGVDGIRLDAIPYLHERDGTSCENLEETHAELRALRAHVEASYPEVMLLAEANQWPEDAAAYFGEGDECHMNFHFPLMPRLFMAIATGDRTSVMDILDRTPPIPPACQWAVFLRNHDELTLEMVTDEERSFMYDTYAKDPRAPINVGIRRRLAPLLDGDQRKIRLLTSILLSMPGTPVLYYGDELGMGDDLDLPDRDGVRTPMQWDASPNAGFSSASKLYAPVISDEIYGYERVSVAAQEGSEDSLLEWTRAMLAHRREHAGFGRGTLEWLDIDDPAALGYAVRHDSGDLYAVANLADRTIRFDVGDPGATRVTGTVMHPPGGGMALGPYEFVWLAAAPTV